MECDHVEGPLEGICWLDALVLDAWDPFDFLGVFAILSRGATCFICLSVPGPHLRKHNSFLLNGLLLFCLLA